ncbi:MAG: hypothetical protein AABZ74_08215 [Cyanobacteriota bacterium]
MSALLYKKYSPDEGIYELLNGENIVPNVTSGNTLTAKDWKQEALLRLIINKTEIDVSQYFGKLPSYQYEELVDWISLRDKVKSIINLADNETIIFENGKIRDTISTSTEHPRAVFIDNNYKYFDNFETSFYPFYEKTLKSNFNFSGTNEFFEEQYRIFDDISNEYFNGSLDGRFAITAGFGIKGTAQASAIYEKGGVVVVIDVNSRLLEKRVEDGFCNRVFYDTESAIDYAIDMKKSGIPKIIGLVGNASEALLEVVNKGVVPNIVTDATPSDQPLSYLPIGYRFSDSFRIKRVDPEYYIRLSNHSMMLQVKAMIDLQKRGSFVFEFGDNLKTKAYNKGLDSALAINNIDPIIEKSLLNLSNKVIIKWVAISNNQEDIFLIDDLITSDFYDNPDFSRLTNIYSKFIFNKNLPSRKAIVDKNEAKQFIKKINEMIRNEEISCPILITTSKLDSFVNDELFFSEGFVDFNNVIKNLDVFKNTDFVDLTYLGNQDKYHKMEQKSMLIDGSDFFTYKLDSFL